MVTELLSRAAGTGYVAESPLSILYINGAVVVRPRDAENTPPNAEHLTDRELAAVERAVLVGPTEDRTLQVEDPRKTALLKLRDKGGRTVTDRTVRDDRGPFRCIAGQGCRLLDRGRPHGALQMADRELVRLAYVDQYDRLQRVLYQLAQGGGVDGRDVGKGLRDARLQPGPGGIGRLTRACRQRHEGKEEGTRRGPGRGRGTAKARWFSMVATSEGVTCDRAPDRALEEAGSDIEHVFVHVEAGMVQRNVGAVRARTEADVASRRVLQETGEVLGPHARVFLPDDTVRRNDVARGGGRDAGLALRVDDGRAALSERDVYPRSIQLAERAGGTVQAVDDLFARIGPGGANNPFQRGVAGDDVRGGARVDRSDGDHGGRDRVHVA